MTKKCEAKHQQILMEAGFFLPRKVNAQGLDYRGSNMSVSKLSTLHCLPLPVVGRQHIQRVGSECHVVRS